MTYSWICVKIFPPRQRRRIRHSKQAKDSCCFSCIKNGLIMLKLCVVFVSSCCVQTCEWASIDMKCESKLNYVMWLFPGQIGRARARSMECACTRRNCDFAFLANVPVSRNPETRTGPGPWQSFTFTVDRKSITKLLPVGRPSLSWIVKDKFFLTLYRVVD